MPSGGVRSSLDPSRRTTQQGLQAPQRSKVHASAEPSQEHGTAQSLAPATRSHPTASTHDLTAAGEAGSKSAAAPQEKPTAQPHAPAGARQHMHGGVIGGPASRSMGAPSVACSREAVAKPPRPPRPAPHAASQALLHHDDNDDAKENMQPGTQATLASGDTLASSTIPPKLHATPGRKQQISWNSHPLPVHLGSLTKLYPGRSTTAQPIGPANHAGISKTAHAADGLPGSTAGGAQTAQALGREGVSSHAGRDAPAAVSERQLPAMAAESPSRPPLLPATPTTAGPHTATQQPTMATVPVVAQLMQPPATPQPASKPLSAWPQPTLALNPAPHLLQPPVTPLPTGHLPNAARWAATPCSTPTLQIAQDGTVTPARTAAGPASMEVRLHAPAGLSMRPPPADMGMGPCMPASTPLGGGAHFAGIVPRLPLDGNRSHLVPHRDGRPLPRSGTELHTSMQDAQAQAAAKSDAASVPVAPRSMGDSKVGTPILFSMNCLLCACDLAWNAYRQEHLACMLNVGGEGGEGGRYSLWRHKV